METTFENACVDDRVWSIEFGWGTIKNVDNKNITVYFGEDGLYEKYKKNGSRLSFWPNQTLFWDEIKIDPPPRPKRKVTLTVDGWAVKGKNYVWFFNNFDDAKNQSVFCDGSVIVKVSGSYEVEE